MNSLITTLTGVINSFMSIISNGLNLANFYSNNWGKYIVYALMIFVASKIFKIKLGVDVKKGR